MGYTRYWTRTESPMTDEFIGEVRTILADCKARGITICDSDGTGEPTVTKEIVCFNGPEAKGLDHESFHLDGRAEWDFCKTAEKPYDYAVKEILKAAERHGIVKDVSDDGETEVMSDAEYLERR